MTPFETMRLLSLCLRPTLSEDEESTRLRQRLERAEIPWEPLIWLASNHLVTPTLYWSFKRQGLIGHLPTMLQDYLHSLHALNHERNQAIRRQALEVIHHLNTVGIEPLLLKGAAGLLSGLYPDTGARVIGDIDLLVPKLKVQEAVEVLHTAGFQYVKAPSQLRLSHHLYHHAPPLWREDLPTSVELHTRLTSRTPHAALLDVDEIWRESFPYLIEGHRCRLPLPHWRLLHNFFHTQIQDRNHRFGRINLRQLLDWVWLREALDPWVAWPDLFAQVRRHRLITPFEAYLLSAQAYFQQSLPAETPLPFGARMQLCRQRSNANNTWFRRLNAILVYGYGGLRILFSDEAIKRRHGEVTRIQGWLLRLGDLMSVNWHRTRWAEIKQLLR